MVSIPPASEAGLDALPDVRRLRRGVSITGTRYIAERLPAAKARVMARNVQPKSSPVPRRAVGEGDGGRRSFFSFERLREPIATRRVFIRRMGVSIAVWFGLMFGGLAVGMAGYAHFEGMSATDAFVNAAMILSGMGPVDTLHTDAGKLFAGSYAIFSGLVIVIATGVVLSPIIHHVLHVFHADPDETN
ncbi:hypothetical protein [Ancylobacter terrae]|uniref:hypothetical protein n=1 Tax=Ancylobacter sp. sgz301288 TaxID=3342077 RepID=UPI00385C3609